jgi:hypothetical protein
MYFPAFAAAGGKVPLAGAVRFSFRHAMFLSLDPPCEFDGSAVIKSVSERTVADSSGMAVEVLEAPSASAAAKSAHIDDPENGNRPITRREAQGTDRPERCDSHHQQKLLESPAPPNKVHPREVQVYSARP